MVRSKLVICSQCGGTVWETTDLMDDLHNIGTCFTCKHKQSLMEQREKVEVEHLYNPKDVKRIRDEFVKRQNGIDPILKERFKEVAVLDHCHSSQHVRAALNRNCNAFEGKVVNAYVRCLKWLTDKPLSEILRNLADYYEDQERVMHKNPLHPAWIKRVNIEFNKLTEASKRKILKHLGCEEGANASERKRIFNKLVLSRKFTYFTLLEVLKHSKEAHG